MTDITIPPQALEAAAKKVGHHRFVKQWDLLTLYEQDLCRFEARADCLAMLKAWPGVDVSGVYYPWIILPLPDEASNA